jgi:hypothetical protein
MADNPAHDTPPGPGPDPLDAAFATPKAPPTGEVAAATPTPSFAEYTGAGSSDVEVVGRNSVSPAQAGDVAEAPVLVGAGASTWQKGHAAAGVMGPREADPLPAQRLTADPARDLPTWSFRERTPRTPVAPSPPAPVDRNQAELPLAAAAKPVEAARPHPLFGPIGRPRSAVAVALLAVVTLGISALVWHHRVNRELEEFDPKLHSRPVRSTAAVAIPWLVGLLVTVAGAALIVGARLSFNLPLASHVTGAQTYYMLAGLAAVPYLTLLAPFSAVAVVMTLERLRCVEEHVGTTTDRQVRAVGSAMLLLIPVVGGLVLLSVAQRRINVIWAAVAPAGRLSH